MSCGRCQDISRCGPLPCESQAERIAQLEAELERLQKKIAAVEERVRIAETKCETCGGTGWYRQNGPGPRGHGDQWCSCDQCNTGRAQKPVERLLIRWDADVAAAVRAVALAEKEKP
ncbi:MAG: hypothetical protein MUF54_08255 [Polyangiaceae bacterium]|jgi:hypothetical protein|nr:hypothetical protein [Polyangiaceae bacterium]